MMLGTNQQFEDVLASLDRQIPKVEFALRWSGGVPGLAEGLVDLCTRRHVIRMVMLNRRVEASRKVVNLLRWRDGNGAVHLMRGQR